MGKSNDKNIYRGVTLYIDGREVKGNATEIRAEMKKLRNEIDACTMGSEEYVQKTKRYRELNTILDEHRAALRNVKQEQTSVLDKGVNLFNKYAASGAAVIATITGVAMKLNSFRKQMNEVDESKASVKALTGLDDASIDWLEQQAYRLSTTMDETGLRVRESASEILGAYTLIGSNKPELLGVKEDLNAVTVEAMRLASASEMDLKDAADAVTTALNQYGAGAREANKYVNVLAAGSQAGAASVEQQTASILKAGTIAATSNIAFEELVGSIEMLAEKGIKSEIAGTGLKTFFTRLAAGSADTNPKVVGLSTALDNLNKQYEEAEAKAAGGGVQLFQKLFGLEGMQTAMILSQNAEGVRRYTEAVTDTNIAMEQAAINSDTANAKLAQVRNELNRQGIVLVQKLNPAIMKFLNGIVNTSRYTVRFVDFLQKNRVALLSMGTAFTLYYGWQQRKIIADKLSVLWSDKLTVSIKNVGKALSRNPWGIALVAIGAVTGALIDYNRRMKEAEQKTTILDDVNKKAGEEYDAEAAKIDALRSVLSDNNIALDERRRALNELKKIVPDYLGELTDEGTLINDNNDALEDYLVNLEKEIRLKAAKEELEVQFRKKRQLEKLGKEQDEQVRMAQSNYSSASAANYARYNGKLSTSGMQQMAQNNDIHLTEALHTLDKAKELRQRTADELAAINSSIELLSKEINSNSSIIQNNDENGEGPDGDGGGGGTPDLSALDRVEREFAQKRLAIKQQYLDGEIATQADYNLKLAELDVQLLEEKLKIAGLEPEKVAEIKGRLLDLQIKAKEDLVKAREDAANEELAIAKQQYLDDIYEAEMAYYRGEKSKEEHLSELTDLRTQYYETVKSITNLGEKELNAIVKEQNEQELKDAKEQYEKKLQAQKEAEDAQIESYKDQAQTYMDLSRELGNAFDELFSEEEDSFKNFVQNILVILLDAWEKQLVATQAAAIANVTMTDISEKGFAGIATAAGKVALITAAFEAAKGLLKSFDTGGYTPHGPWNEPQGIVHSNEFVANRFAVANPAVRPLLDLLDQAQRSGSIAHLTTDDIAAVYGRPSLSPTTVMPIPTEAGGVGVSPELLRLLMRIDNTMASAEEAYKRPSRSYCFLNGEGGIKRVQELDEKIVNNAKRRTNATTNH